MPGGSAVTVLPRARQLVSHDTWARLRLTWVDERCVPFHDERSNRGTVYRQEVLDPDVG